MRDSISKSKGACYQAYVLRLWRERSGAPWHASLQEVGTDQRHGFADLEALLAFLREQTQASDARDTEG